MCTFQGEDLDRFSQPLQRVCSDVLKPGTAFCLFSEGSRDKHIATNLFCKSLQPGRNVHRRSDDCEIEPLL